MLLGRANQQALLAAAQSGDDLKTTTFIDLIRSAYPELWDALADGLARGREIVEMEPDDVLEVVDGQSVLQRGRLLRRRIESARRQRARAADPDAFAELDEEALEELEGGGYEGYKDINAPKTGIVSIEGQPSSGGRIVIETFKPLSGPSQEIRLAFYDAESRRATLEAFATRCIPVALNTFLDARVYLASEDTLLVAKTELHGTERLEKLLGTPMSPESEHYDADYAKTHPEAYAFFASIRDAAFQSEERRAERSIAGLPDALVLEILAAIAIPRLHNGLGCSLRMQYAFIQPETVVGATLVRAGAALQPAWSAGTQLRVLARGLS